MIVKRRNDLIVEPIESAEPVNGRDGLPGSDGKAGADGSDGSSLNPRGTYRRGRTYNRLDLVRYEDASWVCVEDGTKSAPPRGFQLLSRDGADGRDGEDGVGSRGPRGRDGVTTVVSGGGSGVPFIGDGNILKGQALVVTTADHCSPGLADDFATSAVVGLAASDVGDGMAGLMLAGGTLEMDDWSAVTGSASLSPGVAYYLSTTVPGGLTTTPPTDDDLVVTFVGRALSATVLAIELAPPIQLSNIEDWPEE